MPPLYPGNFRAATTTVHRAFVAEAGSFGGIIANRDYTKQVEGGTERSLPY